MYEQLYHNINNGASRNFLTVLLKNGINRETKNAVVLITAVWLKEKERFKDVEN